MCRYDRLSRIICPVLLLSGGLDILNPSYLCIEMMEKLSNAHARIFVTAAHVLPLEKTRGVMCELDSFLSRYMEDDVNIDDEDEVNGNTMNMRPEGARPNNTIQLIW